MLGVFEAQGVGNNGDGLALQQHAAGFFHQVAADVARGGFAGAGADKVPEIVGRKAKFAGAVPDAGDAASQLSAFGIVAFQCSVYLSAEIILRDHLELALVIACGKLQQQGDIRQDDAPKMRVLGKFHQFFANGGDAALQAEPFFRRGKEGFVAVIGEEMVIFDEAFQGGSRQKIRMEKQNPALDVNDFPIIGDSPFLPRRNAHERPCLHLVGSLPVLDGIRALFHQEKAVNAIFTETMAAPLKFVVVDDAHQRMQLRSAHIPGVIIDRFYMKDLFHASKLQKRMQIP